VSPATERGDKAPSVPLPLLNRASNLCKREDRRARSKALGSGPSPAGVRRFESGSSHCFCGVMGIL
jgi:hypothetical protein